MWNALECAAVQQNQYQQALKIETNQLWDAEKMRPLNQQLTSIMRNLTLCGRMLPNGNIA